MWKLTKYEFRKNLTSILIVLMVLAAAQIYFTTSWVRDDINNALIAAAILMVVACISFLIVVAFGVSTYTKELNSKSSYLIFMTPNSSLKIILSKMLYTFLFGAALALLLLGLGLIDIKLITLMADSPFSYLELLKEIMTTFGIDYLSVIYGIISAIISMIIILFFIITLSYFSTTLASTVLQNKKGKGFVSTVLFVLIFMGIVWIDDQIPVLYPNPGSFFEATTAILPSVLFQLVVIVLFILASAKLLDKKVSL